MLTSFGALYAGYIDMENVGYDDTPVDDRWFAHDRLQTGVWHRESVERRELCFASRRMSD